MFFSLLRDRTPACLAAMLVAFLAAFPGAPALLADFTFARCIEKGGDLKFEYRLASEAEVTSVAVTQNGKPLECQHTAFAGNPLTPGAVLVMVDTSAGSTRAPRDRTLAHNKALIETLMAQAQPQNLVGIYGFANDLTEVAPLARPVSDIHFRLIPLKADGLGTRIYRQGMRGVELLAAAPAKRKALVILSDGKDEDNGFTREDLVASALGQDIIICAMGCPETGLDVPALGNLEKLAVETHGIYTQAKIGESEPGERLRSDNAFARTVLGLVNSGGEITVPLAVLSGTGDVVFTVHAKGGETATYLWQREARPEAKPEPQAPAAPTVPADPAPEPPLHPVPAADVPAPPASSPAATAPAKAALSTTPGPTVKPVEAAKPAARPAAQIPTIHKDSQIARLISVGAIVLLAMAVVILRYRSRPSGKTAAAQTGAYLLMQDAESRQIPLTGIATRIGRRPENDIVFSNTSVSGYHAEIHLQHDGAYLITDLGSGNGLKVNDKSVSQATLHDGDLVEMGEVRFRFHLASSTP